MASGVGAAATELATTLQAASVNRDPDPQRDINPSTAASKTSPVEVASDKEAAESSRSDDRTVEAARTHAERRSRRQRHRREKRREGAEDTSDDIDGDISDEQDIPISILSAPPRPSQQPPQRQQHKYPPLPDLRFEQSYLARIDPYKDNKAQIAWITFFDHVFMPLSQGVLWHLLGFGWTAWNRNAAVGGKTIGGRLRRWWWGVNNWPLPERETAPKVQGATRLMEKW
ncbi:MAG: hypothetical protein M1831_005978 [Alyxoria varia]|nr:MAG: hypothetical protein M1831_005978 [Alyxoria varia]